MIWTKYYDAWFVPWKYDEMKWSLVAIFCQRVMHFGLTLWFVSLTPFYGGSGRQKSNNLETSHKNYIIFHFFLFLRRMVIFFFCVFFNFFINFCFSTNTSWAFVSGKKNVLGWWEKNYALQLTYIGDPCSGLKKTQLLTASWFCGIAYQVKMTRRRQDCAQQNQKKKVLEILERNFLQLFRRKWKTLL